MFKPNNKKMLTVLIAVAMIFSAFAVLSMAAHPAFAQSASVVAYTPVIVSPNQLTDPSANPIVLVATGGTFTAGQNVYFYWSSTDSVSGLISTSANFNASLPAGVTTLSSTLLTEINTPIRTDTSPGDTLYLLASNTGPTASLTASYMGSVAFTVAAYSPTITITPASQVAGGSILVGGSGFSPASSYATIYIDVSGTNIDLGTVSLSAGSVIADQYITVPTNLPKGAYPLFAVDESTGVTAATSLTIEPKITVSPASISGSTSSTFAISGYGFPAGQVFSASSATSPSGSITVGRVDTFHAAVTVSSSGSFSVSITGLQTAIASYGGATIVFSSSAPSSFSASFADAIYVSVPNPAKLGFSFTDLVTGSSTYGYPMDSISATVWDFPADSTVSIAMGAYVVGTITTDSNGYGTLPSSAAVPQMPGGTYTPVASDSSVGLSAVSSSFTVETLIYALDPAGVVVSNEYVPFDGKITVYAYGLLPTDSYYVYDSGSGGNVFLVAVVTSVSVGTINSAGTAAYPASNGTLILTYEPYYSLGYAGVITGTRETITLEGQVIPSATSAPVGSYYEIGAPMLNSTAFAITTPGATIVETVSNMVPESAIAIYPTENSSYSLYLGTSLLTVTLSNSKTSTTFTSTSVRSNAGTATVSFLVPTLSNGVYNLSIVYASASVSSALNSVPLVVSTSSSSLSAGSLTLVATKSGYETVGYGFYQPAGFVTLYIMTATGLLYQSGSRETLTDGAFVSSLITTTVLNEPAGTYAVFAVDTIGTSSYTAYSSYTVVSNVTLVDSVTGLYNGYVGDTVTLNATGIQPDQFYAAYFDNMEVATFSTGSSGSVSGVLFKVPIVRPGNYMVNLTLLTSAPAINSTVPPSAVTVASAGFEVLAYPNITLSTDAPVAFPGQLVTFSWTPTPAPAAVGSSGGAYGPIEVSVNLNGTPFTTEPAAYALSSGGKTYLNGSFQMPNAPAGTYYRLTLTWTQVKFGTPSTVSTYTSSGGAYIQLINGSGAFVLNISSSQIATLTVAVSNAVTTSMKVPLSELNASVVAINGAIAKINTAFGNMTASLKAINATVASIESGQATVVTDLGSISTSLASLNASIVGLNHNVVVINTTLGQVTASLTAINGTVSSIMNGQMIINTTLGKVTASLKAINATVSSIMNGQAIINTTLGKMTASLSSVNASIISLRGNVAVINTTLGKVTASLSAINATVTSTASGVSSLQGSDVTIISDLGTINGKVSSISNGTALIQTNLGTLAVNVSQIKTSVDHVTSVLGTTEIFEIVILVLVLITLVLSFLAISAANRVAKRVEEQKKQ
ncbi:MAG: hypothetical protein QXU98_03755 [Candidatus Parvarchaeota archaeon]